MPGWKRGKTLLPSHVAATAKVVPLLSAPISQEDRAKEGARPNTVHTSSIKEEEHHLPSHRLHRLCNDGRTDRPSHHSRIENIALGSTLLRQPVRHQMPKGLDRVLGL
jgi:hypothetical protein